MSYLSTTVGLVEETGRHCLAIKADVRNQQDMHAVAKRTISEFGDRRDERADVARHDRRRSDWRLPQLPGRRAAHDRASFRPVVATSSIVARMGATNSGHYALHDPDGLDVSELLRLRDDVGDAVVHKNPAGQLIEAGRELLLDADVLVPAARQDVIDEQLATALRARFVIEGANLPTSPAAQHILTDRGIIAVPDQVANAGGAIAAAFAMDARYSPFPVNRETIFKTLTEKLRANTVTALREAQQRQVTTHAAARLLAEERIRAAMQLRIGRTPA